jgi:hypothetical protein
MKLIIMLTVTVHLCGCFWFLLAQIDNFPDNSWIFNYGMDQYLEFTQIHRVYLASIYWYIEDLFN